MQRLIASVLLTGALIVSAPQGAAEDTRALLAGRVVRLLVPDAATRHLFLDHRLARQGDAATWVQLLVRQPGGETEAIVARLPAGVTPSIGDVVEVAEQAAFGVEPFAERELSIEPPLGAGTRRPREFAVARVAMPGGDRGPTLLAAQPVTVVEEKGRLFIRQVRAREPSVLLAGAVRP